MNTKSSQAGVTLFLLPSLSLSVPSSRAVLRMSLHMPYALTVLNSTRQLYSHGMSRCS
jgi:hypothetical protein